MFNQLVYRGYNGYTAGVKRLSQLTRNTYLHLMQDGIRRNSTLLILSQLVSAGSLFLFWILNARLFPADLVGLATAFVSFGVLVATFTNLGLPNTIIRFLPRSQRRGGLFTAALSLVALSSLTGGVLALLLVPHVVPKLAFIRNSSGLTALLLLLVVGMAIIALLDGTLVSLRKGEYIFLKAVLTNLPRLVLPFAVVAAGVRGMTGVYVGTLLIGICFVLFMIIGRLLASESLRPTLGEVTKHKVYAASNYLGGMFGVLPVTVVPIIVLSVLGPAPAAYFFMPIMIAALLSLICNSISQALISECSQTDDRAEYRRLFGKALRHQYQLLLPLVLILLLLAWPILRIYGPAYAREGFVPLLILIISGLFVGLNWLGDTWLNINKRSRDYFLMNAFNALAVVGFVLLFVSHGLTAVALGWFCGQLLSAVVYLMIFARSHLLSALRITKSVR